MSGADACVQCLIDQAEASLADLEAIDWSTAEESDGVSFSMASFGILFVVGPNVPPDDDGRLTDRLAAVATAIGRAARPSVKRALSEHCANWRRLVVLRHLHMLIANFETSHSKGGSLDSFMAEVQAFLELASAAPTVGQEAIASYPISDPSFEQTSLAYIEQRLKKRARALAH